MIGGGFGGIIMAYELTKAGFDNFVVYEALPGPGGTWWANDYPGAEVDVHSSIYSLPFKSQNWSRTHARQPELHAYIEEALDEFDLRKHFRFETPVAEVRWDESTSTYALTTSAGETSTYHAVVSAVGLLSDPKEVTWDGVDEFSGHIFHSARWDKSVDLAGKTVAVVGVGSTAVQIVPAIAPEAGRVLVYQREPGWILPKGDRDFDEAEIKKFATPIRRRIRRWQHFAKSEWAHTYQPPYRLGSKRSQRGEATALAYIDNVFRGRPDLQKAVTPTYPFSAKRRVLTSDFFPALLRPNVELVPHSVERLTSNGIIDATGTERKADVIVAAIGFKASTFLSTLRVVGRDGLDIHEVWKDGAYAFLGVTLPRFPNFYMMYGPNTNGGAPITYMHQQQAGYVIRNLKAMARSGITQIDVKPSYTERYNRWLQTRMRGTAWLQGNNYFKGPRGQIVTQWADGVILYGLLIRLLRRAASVRRR